MRRAEETAAAKELTDLDVAEFLSAHPDFFDHHPRVLLDLELHHRPGRAAVSLVQRQVALLRKRNEKLESQLKELVAVARDNHELLGKIHQLAMALMAQGNGELRLQVLRNSLRKEFSVERAVLILFAEPRAVPVDERFLKVVDPRYPGLKSFASFLKSGRPRCGVLRRGQKRFAFGDAEVELQSAALVPLGHHAQQGFMVIGSRDPDYFNPGKRTDYLARLGEVVSMAIIAVGDAPDAKSGPKASGT